MKATKEFEIIHTVGKSIKSENGQYKFKILSVDEFTGFIFKETEGKEFNYNRLFYHFKAIHKVVSKKDKHLVPLCLIYFAQDFVPLLNDVFASKLKFKFVKEYDLDVVKPLLDNFDDEEFFFEETKEEEFELDQYPAVSNRCAVRIEPNKLFINWLNYTYEGYVDSSVNTLVATTYLIRDAEENQLLEKWLKKNYSIIFEIELNNYCIDESAWPSSRTYKVFKEWFNIGFSDMIIDLENGPIQMM